MPPIGMRLKGYFYAMIFAIKVYSICFLTSDFGILIQKVGLFLCQHPAQRLEMTVGDPGVFG